MVVTLRMQWGETHVLIQVKSRDLREIQLLFAMKTDQFLVPLEGRAARGQPQHSIRFAIQ